MDSVIITGKPIAKKIGDANEVQIKGNVVGKRVTPKSVILTIATSKTLYGQSTTNYPRVVFFGKEMMEKAAAFKRNDRVEIEASFKTKRKVDNGSTYFQQTIVGNSISYARSILDETFGINGSGRFENENKVKLSGEVIKIEIPSKGIIRFITRVQQGKVKTNISATCFTRDMKKTMNFLEVGARVFVVGEIQTTKKDNHGKVIYYENLVASDIGSK